MRPGSEIVDVAVDQGGCFEITKVTYDGSCTCKNVADGFSLEYVPAAKKCAAASVPE